jgi:hypothetical protein
MVTLPKIAGLWVVNICFATSLSVVAADEQKLPTAERVEQDLEQVFKQCTEEVIAVKPEGNQLISDGLASCNQQVAQQWLDQHEKAKALINQRFGSQCSAMVSAIDTQVDAYAQQVDALEVLGQMPLHSNYDLAHLIAKHRYNLFYYIATGVGGCG